LNAFQSVFLVDETKDALIVAGHKTEVKEPQFCGTMVIPEKSVAQIKKIVCKDT
jgi:hypothetical protein